MDESAEAQAASSGVWPETAAVSVAGGGVGGVQLCPAYRLASLHSIQPCVKLVYSQLAAGANELDEGIPDMMCCLIGGGNALSGKYRSSLSSSLSRLMSASCWLVSSGEHSDPLAALAAEVMQRELPQSEMQLDCLHLAINSPSVCGAESATRLVDTRVNTLLLLLPQLEGRRRGAARAHLAARLAHPPPALLIGVPSSSEMLASQTTSPILLSPSVDRRPLPVCLFAAASAPALFELLEYVTAGVPVVVLQDSCELCAVLHRARLLLATPVYRSDTLKTWLRGELSILDLGEPEEGDEWTVDEVVDAVVELLASGTDEDTPLIEFCSQEELSSLPSRLLEVCLGCTTEPSDQRRAVQAAARLNLPSVISHLPFEELLDQELLDEVLISCCSSDGASLEFLAALLDQKPAIECTSAMLIGMSIQGDTHFYHSIILCQCLGYSQPPSEMDERFAGDVDRLLRRLSAGCRGLFPSFSPHKQTACPIRALALWALLLNRPQLSSLLAAYSSEPLPTLVVLSRVAKSLAVEASDWCFYEERLLEFAGSTSKAAVALLDKVHKEHPNKAYHLLCRSVDISPHTSLTQLAYQCNDRHLLSHESAQRWVHRFLHGVLEVRNSFPSILPRWLKILLAGVLVWPVRCWLAVRPNPAPVSRTSATVALLEGSRVQMSRRRTMSMVSGRSDALTTVTGALSVSGGGHHIQKSASQVGGVSQQMDSSTPQSAMFPMPAAAEDDYPVLPLPAQPKRSHRRRRRAHPPALHVFYSTPVVKYWLAFLLRLLHIGLLAYSVLLPGCGSQWVDAVVWLWSAAVWAENAWVLHLHARSCPLREMPWRVFDVVFTAAVLALMLPTKLFGEMLQLLYVTAFSSRVLAAFYLLYLCYSTLFTFVPMSEVFGPLLVRVRLMLLRDFTNFLLLVALIMTSSAVAMQAVLFPDKELTWERVRKALNWAWMGLFTTDLSALTESDTCRRSFLGAPKEYCSAIGGYSNVKCPSQSIAGYVVVVEYFVLLKLILWPILFALFAKTAKAVDDEAKQIWRFQMYAMVTDLSLRPALPPPLTPLLLIWRCCCCTRASWSTDHPDMVDARRERSVSRFGSSYHSVPCVYRNPSVPHRRHDDENAFWRREAVGQWRRERETRETETALSELRAMKQQLRMQALVESFRRASGGREERRETPRPAALYPSTTTRRCAVECADWRVPLPSYRPPFFSAPAEEFSVEAARSVDVVSEASLCDLRRHWRTRQATESIAVLQGEKKKSDTMLLSADGVPLNPRGRSGLAGRGTLPKFGPNRKLFYVIVSREGGETKVLLTASGELPCEWEWASSVSAHLATPLCISALHAGKLDQPGPAYSRTAPSDEDTDHAWAEHHVYAFVVGRSAVCPSGYSFVAESRASHMLSQPFSQYLAKALDHVNEN